MPRSRGRPYKGKSPERLAAERARLKQYQPSHPCQRGHVAKRFTSNNWCVACQAEARNKKFTGERIIDEKTPERLQRLEHRAAVREKYRVRKFPSINQTGDTTLCPPPNDLL